MAIVVLLNNSVYYFNIVMIVSSVNGSTFQV